MQQGCLIQFQYDNTVDVLNIPEGAVAYCTNLSGIPLYFFLYYNQFRILQNKDY